MPRRGRTVDDRPPVAAPLMVGRPIGDVVEDFGEELLQRVGADRLAISWSQDERAQTGEDFVVFHERPLIVLARIEHIRACRLPDRVAVSVHLEQVLSLAAGEPLGHLGVSRKLAVVRVRF